MRACRSVLLCALITAAAAPALSAQILDPGSGYLSRRSTPSRTYFGLGLLVAQPVGELDRNIDIGGGLGGHLIHQLDRGGAVAVRLDAGFLIYGSETKRFAPFPQTPRIEAEVETNNTIFFAGVGPQLMVPSGKLRPYVTGAVGFSVFATTSSVSGIDDTSEDLFDTRNHDAGTFAWSGAAGLYIPVRRGNRPISIDLGARYHGNGEAEYLREGIGITDNPDGTYSINRTRSQANLIVYQLGVSFGL
jgi:hypothetical protein